MDDPGSRERKLDENGPIVLRPIQFGFTVSPGQPVPPIPAYQAAYDSERTVVADDTKILVVATQLTTQRPVLIHQQQVPVPSKPNP